MDKFLELKSKLVDLDSKIKDLNKEYKSVFKKMKDEEFKVNNENAKLAIDLADYKSLLKVDEENYMVPYQRDFWDNLIKPVNKILGFSGYFEESKQVSLKLKLIQYEYNKDQINKLLPILEKVISNITPVSIHKEVAGKFKVIPVLDKQNGENGSYSLLIDKDGNHFIYCESKMKPKFLAKTSSLKESLIYIAKKYFYYGV